MERLVVTGPESHPRFRDEPPLLAHVDYSDARSVAPPFERYLDRLRPAIALLLR